MVTVALVWSPYEIHREILIFVLVPVDVTSIKVLYVFVDIKMDVQHFLDTIKYNFEKGTHLALVSTIQFVSTLQVRKKCISPTVLL